MITDWLNTLRAIVPWLGLSILIVGASLVLVWLMFKYKSSRGLKHQETIYLELMPPAVGSKKPKATEELFLVLHSLKNKGLFKNSNNVISLEIVSTRAQGIRYMVRLASSSEASFRHTISTYLPEIQIRAADDLLQGRDLSKSKVIEFTQSKHFAYPLKTHSSLEDNDPLSYLTGAMTKLSENELIVFQMVLTPANPRQIAGMTRKIMINQDLLADLSKSRFSILDKLVRATNALSFQLTDLVTSTYHGASMESSMASQNEAHQKRQANMGLKPARILTSFEQELIESIHAKLNQALFRVNIRALVLTRNEQATNQKLAELESALTSFSIPHYQILRTRNSLIQKSQKRLFEFTDRLAVSSNRHSALLSVSEVADLYHFPNRDTHKTENVLKSLSRQLPAPVFLKDGTKLDVLLGINRYHGSNTPIGLTAADRERHVYIVGGTGNGKTTMLLYGIIQDIKNGKGVAVLDPHADLAQTIFRYIPEERIQDVIYLNPNDLKYPIGVNLLELPEGISGDDLLREKDLVTESTISVMRKIFSDDDSGGHRIEYILRNCIQTALTLEGSTLFTVFDLLNDPHFRREVTNSLKDKDLKNFWKNELGKAGDFQRIKMAAGITAKIGRFLFSASAKRVLEQEKSTIDFDDIIASGKILICNFSKGLLGEDTSTLFGTTILAKLQMAALRRARLQQNDRKPFYLYVDEFQNFATMAFVQMLSEARKYKLFLTMAEQSTSQQDQQRLVDIIMANVGTVICFRSGSPTDERYILPLFRPYIEQGEIANLPSFSFYMRIAAMKTHEPLSGETVLLKNSGNTQIAERVIESSRKVNAIEYREPEIVVSVTVIKSKKIVNQTNEVTTRENAHLKLQT